MSPDLDQLAAVVAVIVPIVPGVGHTVRNKIESEARFARTVERRRRYSRRVKRFTKIPQAYRRTVCKSLNLGVEARTIRGVLKAMDALLPG